MNANLKKKLDLSKRLVLDLSKKKGIDGLVAQVILCLDYSVSMSHLYSNNSVQEILERIVPLAMAFDDNGEMELFLFHNNAIQHNSNVTEQNVENFIKREVYSRYSMGGTNYAPPIKIIHDDCIHNCQSNTTGGGLFAKKKTIYSSSVPVYVIFITDGENSDRGESERAIKNASYAPVFFQFVGIGDSSFSFLEKLDDMAGRYIDNANFFHVNDLNNISDETLYDRLLGEFPSWIKEAKNKNILL